MDFSIIIPARNEELNLRRCLDSLHELERGTESHEIIVVDNGSDDQTVKIALEQGVSVVQLPGVTISALRNRGAELAKGTVLAFLDADCTVDRQWLKAASLYLGHKEIAGFGSPPRVPDRSTWVQRTWYQVRKKGMGDTPWLESMNLFVRRDIFLEIGGFDESLVTCEDYDLSIRLKGAGRLVCDDRIEAVHHGEARSVIHFFRKELWRGTGNFRGLCCHGFTWKELPSIAFPAAHCLCLLLFLALFMMAWREQSLVIFKVAASLLFVWQGPIMIFAFWKNRGNVMSRADRRHGCLSVGNGLKKQEKGCPKENPSPNLQESLLIATQLYLLLNVYYTARGKALLQHIRGVR